MKVDVGLELTLRVGVAEIVAVVEIVSVGEAVCVGVPVGIGDRVNVRVRVKVAEDPGGGVALGVAVGTNQLKFEAWKISRLALVSPGTRLDAFDS